MVIAPKPLTDYTPLYKNPSDGTVTTQFDMGAIESIGLLKFDSSAKNPYCYREDTALHKRFRNRFVSGDASLEDAATYKLLSSGQTTGIFQLESSGMREYL